MAICAFCGRDETLHKEHVWPCWLIKAIPDPFPDFKRIRPMGRYDENGNRVWKERSEGTYRTASQVRVVCQDHCNGGWMSTLEQEVQSILEPIAKGHAATLSEHDLQVLAFWAAKTMVMVEYLDNEGRATSAAQRRYLYEHREERRPMPRMKVWLGRLEKDGPLARGYWHNPMRYAEAIVQPGAPMPAPGEFEPGPANTSHTTFSIGHVVLTVLTSSISEVMDQLDIDAARFGLHRIWPPSGPIEWPLGESMDINQLLELAYLFEQSKGQNLTKRED